MGIFSRFNDIVNANILHMLDKAEDPEKMVRLMIQEMEDTLVEVKSSAAKIISEQKNLERQIAIAACEEETWRERAELAVAKERDDLARAALAEKSKSLKLREELQEQLLLSQSSLQSFRDDIKTLECKLVDTKARQKSIVMRRRAADGQIDIHKRLETLGAGRMVSKFEQYERELDRLEGVVGAYKLGEQRLTLHDEFAKLSDDGAIEDELRAIKLKLKPSAAHQEGLRWTVTL